ncbi:hypothetical protein RB195_016220 [Necator americanus]|uniref:Uncharacterized protein n=1 Tax=Necator americanus TaxID=51031 RepID=A0ABR1E8H1_NECAM
MFKAIMLALLHFLVGAEYILCIYRADSIRPIGLDRRGFPSYSLVDMSDMDISYGGPDGYTDSELDEELYRLFLEENYELDTSYQRLANVFLGVFHQFNTLSGSLSLSLFYKDLLVSHTSHLL